MMTLYDITIHNVIFTEFYAVQIPETPCFMRRNTLFLGLKHFVPAKETTFTDIANKHHGYKYDVSMTLYDS